MSGLERRALARELMDAFAEDTGLASSAPPRRYLWTDAFAVCNYLGFHAEEGRREDLDLALSLVEQVHRVLGHHRREEERSGWISGLSETEGAQHPTAGGLRIGKTLPERHPGEPFDTRLEWERDGQYYHYLTRWMHALQRVSQVTFDDKYHRWAVELAEIAHRGFVVRDAKRARLHWKMSIDLTRPLVPSSGHHDPLDGLVTTSSLVAFAPPTGREWTRRLDTALRELGDMCVGTEWTTHDPLGLGGLLGDVRRYALAKSHGGPGPLDLLGALVADAGQSLSAISVEAGLFHLPAEDRLAFRELGLSIGLAAIERLGREARAGEVTLVPLTDLERLDSHRELGASIEAFWSDPAHRRERSWAEHRDINAVMLATALAANGYLGT